MRHALQHTHRQLRLVAVAAFSVAALGATTLPSTPAAAYSVSLGNGTQGVPVRWFTTSLLWTVDPACASGLNQAACLQAVRDSFNAWVGHSCSALSFVEDSAPFNNPQKNSTIFGASNGRNELMWIGDNRWVYGSGVLGITAPFFNPQNGQISEADIIFNDRHHQWTTSGQNFSTDIVNVAVHEIGHMIGIQHVLGGYDPNNPPTMATTADPFMNSRTPEPDDIDALCFLYPQGSFQCSSNDDCPLIVDDGPQGEYYAGQITCETSSGLCGGFSTVIPEGTAQLGDNCSGDFDCVGNLQCYPVAGNTGECTQECQTSPDSCPSSFECIPYQNAPSQGLCFASNGNTNNGGSVALGSNCTNSSECQSQLCVQGPGGTICRQPCAADNNCPSGQECEPLPNSGGLGACIEVTTQPPTNTLPNGSACEGNTDCQSNLCVGSGFTFSCAQACSAAQPCPGGFDCRTLNNGAGACFQSEDRDVGDSCEGGSQCTSDLCFDDGAGGGYCAGPCTLNTDCPCGMVCQNVSYNDGGGTVSAQLCNPGPTLGCIPEGSLCSADTECASGTCHNGACARGCSAVLGGAECAAGEGCARITATGVAGICFALGPNATGAPCGQDNACGTLFCHENVCRDPCNPSISATTCPTGKVCEGTDTPGIGYCADAVDTPPGTVTPPGGTPPGGTPGTPGTGSDSGGCQNAGLQHSWLALLLASWLLVKRRRRAA